MPIYSYHCEQCQTEFTELRRCSEMDAPIDCPECGGRETVSYTHLTLPTKRIV